MADGNVKTMLHGLGDVAMKVGPALIGGGPQVLALATSVVALIKVAEQTFKGDDDLPRQLPAEREKIEQAIRDHVAATTAKLRRGE